MSDTVVDSSVVAKWILPDPDSSQADRLITEVALKDGRLIVLDLAFVEVTKAIWKEYYRGLVTLGEAHQLLDKLGAALSMSNLPTVSSNQLWKSP